MALNPIDPPFTSSDPYATYVNTSCLDLLLIELVPMAYRIAAGLSAREQEQLHPARKNNAARQSTATEASASSAGAKANTVAKANGRKTINGTGASDGVEAGLGIGGIGGTAPGLDEEELREAVFYRLESLGYRVGLGVVERFSRDKPRFTDTLDAIKFLCKDLWQLVFKKQIDNLKTNHRGIYVLTDNTFKPLQRMSFERGREGMLAQAQPFLFFPSGLLRGALSSLGIEAQVQAESAELPSATFQIRTAGAKP